MTGLKIYGTPTTYRILNEKSENVTINEKYLQMLEVESKQRGRVLNKKDQNDLKYFQEHFKAIDNNKDKNLKEYLNSFNKKNFIVYLKIVNKNIKNFNLETYI